MEPLGRFDTAYWLKKKGRQPNQVRMGQPREITCWSRASITDGMAYAHTERNGLLPFKLPALPADLNEGFPHEYVAKPDDSNCGVETIVEAAQLASVPLADYNFLTYRNNLNKVLLTPVNVRDAWVVDACRMGRCMFLDVVKLPDTNTNPHAKRFEYYGYKFEALCTTAGSPAVDATSEFVSVLHLHLGDHRMVVGAEIDCYDPALAPAGEPPPLCSYLELKTYRVPQNARQESTLRRFKYPRWWVQSWLAGVPRLALGGRDDEGMLRSVQVLDTASLPRAARDAGADWQPHLLLAFGHDVLGFMRSMGAKHPDQQLRFAYDPASRVINCCAVLDGSLVARLSKLLRAA